MEVELAKDEKIFLPESVWIRDKTSRFCLHFDKRLLCLKNWWNVNTIIKYQRNSLENHESWNGAFLWDENVYVR